MPNSLLLSIFYSFDISFALPRFLESLIKDSNVGSLAVYIIIIIIEHFQTELLSSKYHISIDII